VELYKKEIYIIETGPSSRSMDEAMGKMVRLGLKLVLGERIGLPQEEGYLARGLRRNVVSENFGAERAIRALLAKIKGEPFSSEINPVQFDEVTPALPIQDLTTSTIALVTEGGLVRRETRITSKVVGQPDMELIVWRVWTGSIKTGSRLST